MSPAGPCYSRKVITGLRCVSYWTTKQSQCHHWSALCLQLGHDTVQRWSLDCVVSPAGPQHSRNVITGLGCVSSWTTIQSQGDHWTVLFLKLDHNRTQVDHLTGLCLQLGNDTVARCSLDCVVSPAGPRRCRNVITRLGCVSSWDNRVAR